MYHVTPINDLLEHDDSSTCWCYPRVENYEGGDMVCIHNAKDKREILEELEDDKEHTDEDRVRVLLDYVRQINKDDDIVLHVKQNLIVKAYERVASSNQKPRTKMHTHILRFIEAVKMTFPHATYWCTRAGKAGCYRFYLLLESVFNGLNNDDGNTNTINALSNVDHVITRINGRCYDITGEVDELGFNEITDDEIKQYELLIYGSDMHWVEEDIRKGVIQALDRSVNNSDNE